MPNPRKVKLLTIYVCEDDKFQGGPLHEALIQKCRDLEISGATVFRGLEGYGETAELHHHHLLGHHQPIVILIADSDANIQRLLPEVEKMMDTGLIAMSDVDAIRVERRS